MRYYDIKIYNKDGSVHREYTSFVNGKTLPGALNIVLDVPVFAFATPAGAAYVQVWGISLQDIGQSSNLNQKGVRVYAGMQKGLPLANPAQAGLIVEGVIQQALGNWHGVEQTLDLIIQADGGTAFAPKNIVLNWMAGTTLASAIASTLSTAFPGYKQSINISPKLVLAHDEQGFYATLNQFGQHIKAVSQSIIGGPYSGVDLVLKDKAFVVYDGTSPTSPRQIAFQDLMGQPTWISLNEIIFSCPMRSDLHVSNYIKLPPTLTTTTQQSQSQFRGSSVFQGTFQITFVRHVGNFRQSDGEAWITTIRAATASSAVPSKGQ